MCCPYFMPTGSHEAALWPHRQRLPLGDGFNGCCSAPGHEGEVPTDTELKDCNLGYAACFRLPSERVADAIRFCVACDAGQEIEILYVSELSYLPRESGRLRFSRETRTWLSSHRDDRIQRKAECVLRAYLDRCQSAATAVKGY